jgi:hypothetical protein
LKLNDDLFKETRLLLSIRFLLAILLFFGYAIQYTQKINMSVAIVCMVNNTALLEQSKAKYYENNTIEGNFTRANYTDDVIDPCLFKAKSAKKGVVS